MDTGKSRNMSLSLTIRILIFMNMEVSTADYLTVSDFLVHSCEFKTNLHMP